MVETVPTRGSGAPPDDIYVVDSPYEVARWRPLVHWAMHIPHHIIIQLLNLVTGVVFVIYWISLLATGRLDRGMYSFLVMVTRYEARAVGFLLGFSERYPPFDFDTGSRDNGVYPPVRLNVPAPPEATPRRAALNCILAIPHYLTIVAYGFVAAVIMIIGWFTVVFTGAWPARPRDYLVKLGNYYMRVWLYVTMIETRYPRFGP